MYDLKAIEPQINIKGAILAAFIAGAAFTALEMLMVAVFMEGSLWATLRMTAAIGMGDSVLQPATFDAVVMAVALLIHFTLSLIFAFVVAFMVRGRDIGTAVGVGAAFGLTKYLVSFYGMTELFPWFAMARGWVSIFTHVVYGVLLGLIYASVSPRVKSPVHFHNKPAIAAPR